MASGTPSKRKSESATSRSLVPTTGSGPGTQITSPLTRSAKKRYKSSSLVAVKAAGGGDLSGSRRQLILWSHGHAKRKRRGFLFSEVPKREDIDKLLTGEHWGEGWRPQLCYLSTTHYTPPKTQGVLQLREFESNGLDISEIQGKLRRDYPHTLDVETIMIMGTSKTDEFKRTVKFLMGCTTEGEFEDTVAKLTGKKSQQYFNKPPFVAMLQSKSSKDNKRWQEDRLLSEGGWELVKPESESLENHAKKRKLKLP